MGYLFSSKFASLGEIQIYPFILLFFKAFVNTVESFSTFSTVSQRLFWTKNGLTQCEGIEDDDLVIFELSGDDEETAELLPIEDEALLDEVFEEFCKALEEAEGEEA